MLSSAGGGQISSLRSRLVVVEVLIVRKRLGRIENVNHSIHARMDQADKLEVAFIRESHSIGLPIGHSSAVHTLVALNVDIGRSLWFLRTHSCGSRTYLASG